MTNDQLIALIIALVGGGGLLSFFTAKATAAAKVSEAAGSLAAHFNSELAKMQRYQNRQGRYVRYLLGGIKILSDQVVDLGHEPRWVPLDFDTVCPEDEK
jgi:hypothetical protein